MTVRLDFVSTIMATFNSTLPLGDVFRNYATQFEHISTGRLALLAAVNIPVVLILLNALWQIVRVLSVP